MNRWIFTLILPVLLAMAAVGLDVFRPTESAEEGRDLETGIISLPWANLQGLVLEEALRARRSVRRYTADPLSLAELSQLLFAAQGITGLVGSVSLRTAPSAGALYPIEVYVVVNNVAHLDPGLYHYVPVSHAIRLVRAADLRAEISRCCLDQDFVGQAAVALVMTAVFERTTGKYGQRGVRYVYMEAGHISQNIYLQAASLGLGSVAVGAFTDEQLNSLLGLEGIEETSIYVHAVGKISKESR